MLTCVPVTWQSDRLRPLLGNWACLSRQVGRPGGKAPWATWKLWQARASCLRLFEQDARAAASRTFWTAGSKRPMSTAMIAITTSSSISVNPDRRRMGETSDEEKKYLSDCRTNGAPLPHEPPAGPRDPEFRHLEPQIGA